MTKAGAPWLLPRAVFSIAPHLPFLDCLAEGIAAHAGPDPLALADITVLLPTRRACRSLREAFLRHPKIVQFAGVHHWDIRACVTSTWMIFGNIVEFLERSPSTHPVPLVRGSHMNYLNTITKTSYSCATWPVALNICIRISLA